MLSNLSSHGIFLVHHTIIHQVLYYLTYIFRQNPIYPSLTFPSFHKVVPQFLPILQKLYDNQKIHNEILFLFKIRIVIHIL